MNPDANIQMKIHSAHLVSDIVLCVHCLFQFFFFLKKKSHEGAGGGGRPRCFWTRAVGRQKTGSTAASGARGLGGSSARAATAKCVWKRSESAKTR